MLRCSQKDIILYILVFFRSDLNWASEVCAPCAGSPACAFVFVFVSIDIFERLGRREVAFKKLIALKWFEKKLAIGES